MSGHELTQSKLWLGFIFSLLEFISLGIFLTVGLVMGLSIRWKLEVLAGVLVLIWLIIFISIIICYIMTYANERRQLASKVFTNVASRDRQCGTYFVLCLGAAFYINIGVIILDLIGITLSLIHKEFEGVIEFLLLLGDLILAKHLFQKFWLVSKRMDGKYSLFAETHLALSSHNNTHEDQHNHTSTNVTETTHLIGHQANATSTNFANAAGNVAMPYQMAYVVKVDVD